MGFKDFVRKPCERKQGLKILIYGSDGTGKSVFGLQFPNVLYIDTEGKGFVHENNPKYNKNIVAVADSSNYDFTVNIIKSLLEEDNFANVRTVVIDSETNIYDAMNVAMMLLEEKRAKNKAIKENRDVEFAITDANTSQRAHGKIKNKHNNLKEYKIKLSVNGINVVTIAHLKDVYNDSQTKIGEKPDLRRSAGHEYDIIIKCVKEVDVVNPNKYKFVAYIEKDTTETFSLNDKFDLTCDDGEMSNTIIDKLNKYNTKDGVIIDNYQVVEDIVKEEELKLTFEEKKIKQFKTMFLKLDDDGRNEVKELLMKLSGTYKINDIEDMEVLDKAIKHMEQMEK